jgi:RNA exonuclease 1
LIAESSSRKNKSSSIESNDITVESSIDDLSTISSSSSSSGSDESPKQIKKLIDLKKNQKQQQQQQQSNTSTSIKTYNGSINSRKQRKKDRSKQANVNNNNEKSALAMLSSSSLSCLSSSSSTSSTSSSSSPSSNLRNFNETNVLNNKNSGSDTNNHNSKNKRNLKNNSNTTNNHNTNSNNGCNNNNSGNNSSNSKKKTMEASRFRALAPPLKQHTKLNLTENELVKFLRYYIMEEDSFKILGFPVEYDLNPKYAILYKCSHSEYQTIVEKQHEKLSSTYSMQIQESSTTATTYFQQSITQQQIFTVEQDEEIKTIKYSDNDSGKGSGLSSPLADSDDDIPASTATTTANEINQSDCNQCICMRCGRGFFVTSDGEYLTKEHCVYHWGKLNRSYDGAYVKSEYSCCNGDYWTSGCSTNSVHVWSGVSTGFNGPLEGYVHTQPNTNSTSDTHNSTSMPGVYALDCEMCFTGRGLELTKVTVIASDGRLVYEKFVKPEAEIVDFNTRFSGITEKDLQQHHNLNHHSNNSNNKNTSNGAIKTLKEVQKDLLEFIHADTILIGHSIDNDLRVLKIIHKTVIDTSISFPHYFGLPYRRSLKSLTKSFLKRDIQTSDAGHSSFEDSRASLELILWRIRKDFRQILEQKSH